MVGIDELSEIGGPGPGFQGEKMLVSGSGTILACFYVPFLGCESSRSKKNQANILQKSVTSGTVMIHIYFS